ncbi:hypothetical protein SAMN05216576_107196 [Ectopseudomonas chengduensis]|jgi:hypothetical protein|uniref:Uncharacterized protein n=1 Tax=Ectopseudomonas chengduensis TaxID=489632 RepID=A0A1G6Q1A8_9GAMM|nr:MULTISPECIES: hypothetical protein [Pseudomonas]MBP3062022.1 hypothetical protein [Pseudomonas chengduensis]NNB75316.1 hypothetical protein [Pseudomonas chengduensis]OEO24438.1 hypothetical protein AX279_17365 [Pseudomonas sp. J237]SDC85991.1 hypothetical protein SAMN05216576_107196 [Pseudomonas chengduensis]
MPRTIESIVENHRVAAERRTAGKPVWDMTIDIKSILHEDQSNTSNEHAAKVANRIGALLRSSVPTAWLEYGSSRVDFTLLEIVEGMEAQEPDSYEGETAFTPLDDLNNMLDQLYDWSDRQRVWLGP